MVKIQQTYGKICENYFAKFCEETGKNSAIFNENFEIRERSKTVQRSALCRSRRKLSNEHLLAKFGFDTTENFDSSLTNAGEASPGSINEGVDRLIHREKWTNVRTDRSNQVLYGTVYSM